MSTFPAESRHVASTTSQPRLRRPDGTPIRAVVVDDEDSLTDLLSMALRYEGWDVRLAPDGQKALSVVREFRPDIIVLDIMLPDIDGLQVLQRLRADGNQTPILFLTASPASPSEATTTSPSRSASRNWSRACAGSSAGPG
jgi:two-component system, OmpR family, response regulator